MPHADPEKRRAYFAARYQAKKAEIQAQHREYEATEKGREVARKSKREHERRRRAEQPNRNKAYRYGMTPETFDAWWAATLSNQENACAVCREPFDLTQPFTRGAVRGRPVVDHDHTTGALRGLLCSGCNVQVGFLEKNLDRVEGAARYIDVHSKKILDTDRPAD